MPTVIVALLENMRPKQWAKNVFVFAGIAFDQQLTNSDALLRVLTAFGLLCLTASTIYLINDLVDVEKDRQHPKKRYRPIASGRLPVRVAQAAALVFPTLALVGSALFSLPLTVILILYLILHIAYSFALKNVVIIDVFSIAGGFVLRVMAGVVVIHVENFSPWLYVSTLLLSLFMAVGKRRGEYLALADKALTTRPVFEHYNLDMLNDMLRMTMITAAMTYTIYAIEAETVQIQNSALMLLTVPFVYYGLFRYLYMIYVKEHGGDPTEIIFEDRALQVDFGLWVVVVILLLYVI